MARIVRRPEALEDALTIWLYVARHDIDAADRLAERLDRRVATLAEMPLSGQSRDKVQPGLRSVSVGKYLIFHRALSDGVEVVRILHGARDFAAVFDND